MSIEASTVPLLFHSVDITFFLSKNHYFLYAWLQLSISLFVSTILTEMCFPHIPISIVSPSFLYSTPAYKHEELFLPPTPNKNFVYIFFDIPYVFLIEMCVLIGRNGTLIVFQRRSDIAILINWDVQQCLVEFVWAAGFLNFVN